MNKELDRKICIATHPKTPSDSFKARGRKIHLTNDRKKTLCNMKVTEMMPKERREYTVFDYEDRKCKICFNKINQ